MFRGACLVALALAGACRSADRAGRSGAKADEPPADVQTLGREIFELVDRASAYRSAHRGRFPASVAEMGVDSLTPSTARRLAAVDSGLRVTVAFRRPAGHGVVSCDGTGDVLESASLNAGRVPITCIGQDGQSLVTQAAAR